MLVLAKPFLYLGLISAKNANRIIGQFSYSTIDRKSRQIIISTTVMQALVNNLDKKIKYEKSQAMFQCLGSPLYSFVPKGQ